MIPRNRVWHKGPNEFHNNEFPVDIKKGPVGKNALEIRPVTVNLDKHSRVPTVQVNFCESIPPVAFMLDTGSGLNIIKEKFCT